MVIVLAISFVSRKIAASVLMFLDVLDRITATTTFVWHHLEMEMLLHLPVPRLVDPSPLYPISVSNCIGDRDTTGKNQDPNASGACDVVTMGAKGTKRVTSIHALATHSTLILPLLRGNTSKSKSITKTCAFSGPIMIST
jgi:hypothetical protein